MSEPSRLEFQLRARRWQTVSIHIGLRPKRVDVSVWSPRRCRWRRIGLLPGSGAFRQEDSFYIYNGILQIRSPESRTCVVSE